MKFPELRARRLRKNSLIRDMVRETKLSVDDFIYPIFVIEGENIKNMVPSMDGVYQYSIDRLEEEINEIVELGIKSVILFGIPEHKDEYGSEAYSDEGIIQRAIRKIKELTDKVYVITDVCMCEYTSHGHCGVIENNDVDNDKTLDLLAREAISHVKAGADMVAPSDMMDGRVMRIRKALDEKGFSHIPIMAYSAKFASAFYGPFRDAAESAPQFGDRKSYQMDPANRREALKEVMLDIEENADIVMVKPALAYLDIISDVKQNVLVPVCAYNVSGEYSMVKAAAKMGWIDHDKVMMEMLTSIKRAGADLIITYFAKDAAKLLKED
ncbi:porphobilinogen synthase [Thermotomaculum hydrothermale]|uniref:Delta-aminolevulinic acid dehydratase n=1 Tax=Thermotomaculum hydrothermale TaxID=981385 RepID=A0A7R6SYY7_9BACT|nr:porphobilinogen synthase [Thermotomaculum hydrothermale]BBB32280.1 porphobilinogen synthase [Thermotomaculum hydrothermale]